MLYNVSHTTSYQYADAVSLCHNLVHLRSRQAPRQTCHQSSMIVQPEPRAWEHLQDYFGNPIDLFTIQEPHRKLSIVAKHRIEVAPSLGCSPTDSVAQEQARDWLPHRRTPTLKHLVSPSIRTTFSRLPSCAMPSRRSRRAGRSWMAIWN